MIKAVVFDLDDTLISERDYIASGFKHISIIISKKYNLCETEIYKLMTDKFNQSSENVFNRTLDYLNINYNMNDIRFLINSYREHLPEVKLYDDADYILNYLYYSNNIKLGMITDGYRVAQRNKIGVLNIESLFDYIVVTDELGREYWKPHPKPYEIIKEKLNLEYEEMIYVGDNEQKDFVTANLLGFKTILVKRKKGIYYQKQVNEEHQAQYKVDNLREIKKHLLGSS